MSPSKQRYKEAVRAADDYVYGRIADMPIHFDERQERIYEKYVALKEAQAASWKSVHDDMYMFYTGKTMDEYWRDKENESN